MVKKFKGNSEDHNKMLQEVKERTEKKRQEEEEKMRKAADATS